MKKSNLVVVNLLIACIVGFIVIFPDITRKIGSDNERFPQRERPPFERNMAEEQAFRIPGSKPPQKIISTFLAFSLLTAVLLFINTRTLLLRSDSRRMEWKKNAVSIAATLLVCLIFTLLLELLSDDPHKPFHLSGIHIFQMIFVSIIAMLCGFIMSLIYHQQQMRLENERLKTEKLQSTYDVLMAQMNPHFFFNSLNTLSALVRERQHDISLKYINEMSGIFRYVMHANRKELVSVQQEMNFLNAYRYMLEIRYTDKLFFEIKIADVYLHYRLPVLSLQPVIENVIKHNVISENNPLTIKISVSDGKYLIISNPVCPKLSAEEESGIGLRNLNERYQLLLSEGIAIENDAQTFIVKLPLVAPQRPQP